MLAGKITIKTQLILAVTVPCLALLLVGAASLRSMGHIKQQADELFQNTATPMRAMAEVASRIPRMRVGIDMMLLQDTSLRDEKGVLTRVKETREVDRPEMAGLMAAMTIRPRPTMAAVSTTQSTVTAPSSSFAKRFRMFRAFISMSLSRCSGSSLIRHGLFRSGLCSAPISVRDGHIWPPNRGSDLP